MNSSEERYLDLTIRLEDDHFEVDVYEPESGEVSQLTGEYSFDEHPEFDQNIGEAIMSWILFWREGMTQE